MPLTDLTLYSAAKHPGGETGAAQPMIRMGNWYMALYNLSHEQGRHWLPVLFDREGEHFSSGIYYPERPYHRQPAAASH